jgi:2-dehydro-3-deoxyphosphooctonate aldolase (KDO 8-P synthase)
MNLAGIEVDSHSPFFLIAGPCVIESESVVMRTAERLKAITSALKISLIFKSSFRKGNRTSLRSYSGPGIEFGLRTLERVKREFNVPVLTDVHEDTALDEIADVVDILQTPALLCRQTAFILKVASVGLPVNLKKGPFLSPVEMLAVAEKARSTGNDNLLVCERGTSFGYNDLVVDMRALVTLRGSLCPVVFDATHSVQRPGLHGASSGGDRQYIPALARAAIAIGVAGIFMETHPDPDAALCDGPNAWPLDDMMGLLADLKRLDEIVKVDAGQLTTMH